MDEKVKDLSVVWLNDELGEMTQKEQAFEIIFKDEAEIEALDRAGIVELLALVTDRDAEWYERDDLSFDDLMELLQEIASVLPFGPVFAQRGRASMAFVSALYSRLSDSTPSSPESADGDGQISADVDLDSLRGSPEKSESNDVPH